VKFESVKWNDNKRDDFANMVHNQHNELTSILGDLENIQLNNEGSQQDISIGYRHVSFITVLVYSLLINHFTWLIGNQSRTTKQSDRLIYQIKAIY
jgi:hypothetical protein